MAAIQNDRLPSVAVVILSWNGMSFLEQFLPSVCRSTYPNLSIFVADNDSSDNTVDFLKLSYPNVHILRHPKNNGFADGYNQALRQIKSEYYVLLNQDVEVERGWIEPVISLMEQHGNWAACQPKIRSFTRKQYFEYAGAAGGWMDKWGYTFCRGRLFDTIEVDSGQYDQRTEIFWASGAALFIRSGIFHQLGGFDPSFFAHMEEIDLCWRIHLAGFAVGYCPGSVVYHVGGGSLPQGNPRKTYLNYRNNLLMMSKNLPEQGKESILFLRRILDTIAAVKLLLTGNFQDFRAIIRAHLDFRTLRPQVSVPVSRRLLDLPGVYHGSVVWEYFILGKRRFHDLKKAPNK